MSSNENRLKHAADSDVLQRGWWGRRTRSLNGRCVGPPDAELDEGERDKAEDQYQQCADDLPNHGLEQ